MTTNKPARVALVVLQALTGFAAVGGGAGLILAALATPFYLWAGWFVVQVAVVGFMSWARVDGPKTSE